MPLAHDPWEFFTGDTWEIFITCGDARGKALDVTAATEMEWVLDDAEGVVNYAVLTKTGGGIVPIYPALGQVLVSLPAAQSKLLTANKEYKDMFTLYMPNGNVSTQTFGIITARAKPTKQPATLIPSGNLLLSTTPPLIT